MAKKFIVVSVVLTLLLVAVSSVAAITNGEPDGDGHPYVGVVSNLSQSNFCSGVAISPSVFLTAAHCFNNGDLVLVTFDTSPGDLQPEDLYYGYFQQHPGYCADCGPGLPGAFMNDVAVVWPLVNYLNEPPTLERYGVLPTLGLNDSLANKTAVTLVGYGFQDFIRGGGPPAPWFDQTRHVAEAEVIGSSHAHSDQFLKLSAKQGNGSGGFCLGDSGGPVLQGESDVVLSLSTYATNSYCAGVTYSTRMDTGSVSDFVGEYLSE